MTKKVYILIPGIHYIPPDTNQILEQIEIDLQLHLMRNNANNKPLIIHNYEVKSDISSQINNPNLIKTSSFTQKKHISGNCHHTPFYHKFSKKNNHKLNKK